LFYSEEEVVHEEEVVQEVVQNFDQKNITTACSSIFWI